MKVNVADTQEKRLAAEMLASDSGELGQIVGEMITNPAKLKDFGFSEAVVKKAADIKDAAEDEHPEFAVVRVEEGWSNNRKLWDAQEIDGIVRQVNELEPVGALGHIPDDEESTAFPEPQTTWLAAFTKDEPSQVKGRAGEMVRAAYFAGYNHAGAKIRQHIRTRSVRGISWWGRARHVPIPGKGVAMRDFDLKALDWARKLAEGMPTARILAIASEMDGGEMAELDLAQVTPEQFKKDNPNGYELLRREVEDEHKDTVAEMKTKVDEGEAAKSLLTKACELLGIEKPEELENRIKEMKSKVGERAKATVAASIKTIIAEKVPGDDEDENVKAKRALLTRLLPVAEMESKVADSTDEDAKKIVGEMVDEAFDKDETIKTLIGESAPPVIRRREELRGKLEDNEYTKGRESVSVS
jgi:hypothetical protein